jgi:DNA-binding SARP family transcriptional activator
VEFRLLGPLEVRDQERVLELGGPKRRALLALLALRANEVISTDRLIEDLWGEQPPSSAITALHGHVSRLRKLLNDQGSGKQFLRTRAPGYVLELSADELDLHRFERLREEARALQGGGNLADAAGRLREALALWRGPPLADLAYERFARDEAPRLEELRLAAVEERIEIELALGRDGDLTAELEALVAQHPLRETFVRQHMLALYRSGRQAEALEAYQQGRRRLVEELGIEPGRSLSKLHQAILRQDPALDPFTRPETVGVARGTGFVGRERELAELSAGLEDAFAGRGRLFLLVGEPGIGKSRIAEETAVRARARGAEVLVGRCWEAGGAPAYWPWVQALRMRLDDPDLGRLCAQLGGGAREIAQLLPELAERLPELAERLPELPERRGEGERLRLFDAVVGFLRRASADRPIVLVLDDLHAADTPSLLLLEFLARELASTHVLALGLLRDVDPVPSRELSGTLAEIARESSTARLWLRGLNEQDVAELLAQAATSIASPELAAALHDRTEGNPLFVVETVRLLTREGERPELLGVAPTIHDVIGKRLDHLPDGSRELLGMASVLGREFELAALAQLAGVSPERVLEALDEPLAARVVAEILDAPRVWLRFAHVLIRDTLYEDLTAAQRIRLHRQALAALEMLHAGRLDEHLAELAHHAVAAGQPEQALDHARSAGDRAMALLAYEEAARLYATALNAADQITTSDAPTRCELLLSLGDAHARAGETPAAQKAFLEAAAIARCDLPRELAQAAIGYGGRIVWARAGDDERLIPLLEDALAVVPAEEPALRARLLARLAGALRDDVGVERRQVLSREAVELARRSGDPEALADALNGRAAAIVAPDTLEELLAVGTELRDVAQRIGDKERAAQGHIVRFHAHVQTGDLRGAELDLAAALGLADELRQPAHLWQVRGIEAMLAIAAGRIAEAEELVMDALALGKRAQPTMAIPVYELQRYTLSDFRGSLDEIEPAVRHLVANYPARPVFRCVFAHLNAHVGRLSDAKRSLEDLSHEQFSALPFDAEWLYGLSLLAETCGILGESGAAAVLYDLLQPWALLNVADIAEGIRGSTSRYLAILATVMRRWADAERHFDNALLQNAQMGFLPWVARTQQDFARMLVARDAAGDKKRAEELRSQALETCRELGLNVPDRVPRGS